MQNKRLRGFAALSEEQRKAIARKGGQAAQQKGVAHQFSAEEAREAGRKGGNSVSKDRAHMAEIGKKGNRSRQSQSEGSPALMQR